MIRSSRSWLAKSAVERKTILEVSISALKKNRLNAEITYSQIRLIDDEGENHGIVSLEKAQKIAEQKSLDLVELVPNADPPVCRLMDYGKFRFSKDKKAQQARKKQKRIQVKEVKFRPGTESADYETKMRNLNKFLSAGNKAKVTVRFRGREMMYQERGLEVMKKVENDLLDIATVEQYPKVEGRQMIMVLAPKKK